MASRHLSRSIAMQSLYEWDFNGSTSEALEGILDKNILEFGPGIDDKDFPRKLVHGVTDNLDKIDTIIEKAAPEWPIEQIAVVDRNVLRLGLYELIFGNYEAVPPKVAINEAIELAKSFGGESSGKFVNGVLGTVYRELGEPEKEYAKDEKKKKPLKKEDYAGVVIFRRESESGMIYWLMVRDIFKFWTFVKGHREASETHEQTALREMREEVGLTGKIISNLGQNSYSATTEHGENVLREVTFFLVETGEDRITLEEGGGLTDAKWLAMEEVKATKHYADTNHIIDAAMKKIAEL
ncbi:MAG: transcription antitermination factor NusB [Candidatus Sungbacteria bacterium]|nr:transcription antitermination factor NusB [Candidatus Sungbacteria bacterium]